MEGNRQLVHLFALKKFNKSSVVEIVVLLRELHIPEIFVAAQGKAIERDTKEAVALAKG